MWHACEPFGLYASLPRQWLQSLAFLDADARVSTALQLSLILSASQASDCGPPPAAVS